MTIQAAAVSAAVNAIYVFPRQVRRPDSIDSSVAAGDLFSYTAVTSRCEPVESQKAPWPRSLGGCTLGVNGRALPISKISLVDTYNPLGIVYEPLYLIEAQLLYDFQMGRQAVELEDKNGPKTSLGFNVGSPSPTVVGIVGAVPNTPPLRQSGEIVTVRVRGMEPMDGAAPQGDVPSGKLVPRALIEAQVGGRSAQVVAAELSRTEVGVVEARVAMLFLADDWYTMFLRVAGVDVPTSIIRVSPIGLSLAAIQNALSYTENQVSPGGVITLYGSGMGPDELVSFRLDASGRIPKALAGTEVLFDGIPAPLLYVSGSQLSAIAPFALEGKNSTGIVVSLNGRASVPLTVPVLANDPGLFTINRSGTGQGAIMNQDGSLNSTQNPDHPNQIVVLYGSGTGFKLRDSVSVRIAGVPATVEYARTAPGAVAGFYQINVRIPSSAPSGELGVAVKVGAKESPPGVTVSVLPK